MPRKNAGAKRQRATSTRGKKPRTAPETQPAGFIVNEALDIVEFSRHTGPYLEIAPGGARLNLRKMLPAALQRHVVEAIQQSRKTRRAVHRKKVQFYVGGERRSASLRVARARSHPSRQVCWRIQLEETAAPRRAEAGRRAAAQQPEIAGLPQEPATTKHSLESIIEEKERQYEAVVRELQAANEKLQRTTAESEEATAELEASNTELESANRELQATVIEREEAKEALQEEYAFTSAVLDTVGALVVVLDREGRIVRFNRACEKLTGYDFEEVKDRAFWDLLLVPGEVRSVKKVFRQLIAGRFPNQYENHWLTKNGERRLIAWSNTALSNSRGSVTHVIGTGLDITERRRAEEELRLQSEITKNLSEGVTLVRAKDSTIVYANQRYEEMFGYGPGELAGKHMKELYAPGETNPEAVSRAIRKRLNRDGKWSGDLLNVRKDGTPFWTRASVSTFEHPKYGKVWVGTQSDIDAERQAELALKEREETIAALLESAAQAILAIDERGRIVLANAMAESMFGYSREELLDQPVEMLLPERLRNTHRTHRKSFFSKPARRPMGAGLDLAGRRKSGTEFPIEVGLSSIQTKQDALAVSFITDISERKRAEEEIRRREEELALLAANVPALFSYVGADQRYRFVNRQYEELFNLPKDEIIGKSVEELLGKEAYKAAKEHVEAVLSGRQVSYEAAFPLKPPGLRWMEVTYVPDFNSEGRVTGFFTLVHDVTERKQSQLELENSREELRALSAQLITAQEEERRRIARDLHDDINQKLAVISMSLAALKNTPPKREDLRAGLEQIQRSLFQLSEDVRNVCRELHPSVLEHAGLVAALRASCADFSRLGIRAHFDVKGKAETFPQPVTVCLYRVAQEALRNAARHSGSAEVWVELSSSKRQVRLRVRDQGAGFDPAQLKPGVGFGLTSMEERVRLLGGEFALQSQPGSGTAIDVRIPLTDAKKSLAQGGAG